MPMSDYKLAGGTAFPTSVSADDSGGLNYGSHGMSLRDYFAGQAIGLAGVNAMIVLGEEGERMKKIGVNDITKQAYLIADAMLLEREKKSNGV